VQIIEVGLKFNGPLSYRSKTSYIVLHHAEAAQASVEDIHRWHLANGWSGCGYNYYVRKNGSIYRGRPREAIGAHCQGYNSISVGICAEGDYENESMPPEQWQAILELVEELKQIYPGARVVGHRELNATACPGRYYPLEEIKAGKGPVDVVKEVITGMFPDVPNSHWAKESIDRLAQLSLLKGDEAGNFRPEDPVTRAQLAVVLDRLLRLLGR